MKSLYIIGVRCFDQSKLTSSTSSLRSQVNQQFQKLKEDLTRSKSKPESNTKKPDQTTYDRNKNPGDIASKQQGQTSELIKKGQKPLQESYNPNRTWKS